MSTPARILWKVLGSAVAPLIGAIIGIAAMLLFGWEDLRACAFMISIFVFPVWLLILLPLYVLLPRSSPLWRPTVCTGLGAAAGAILITIFFAVSPDASFELVLIFLPSQFSLVGSHVSLAQLQRAIFMAHKRSNQSLRANSKGESWLFVMSYLLMVRKLGLSNRVQPDHPDQTM